MMWEGNGHVHNTDAEISINKVYKMDSSECNHVLILSGEIRGLYFKLEVSKISYSV